MMRRQTSSDPIPREGHAPDCASHWFEPCDCTLGIVKVVSEAFGLELEKLRPLPAPPTTQHKEPDNG